VAGYLDALRSTLAEMIGDGEGDGTATIYMPDGLSAPLQTVVVEAVEMLIDYQGRSYAQLYLDRLRRFIRRRDVGDDRLAEIATLLATRMAYEDPMRVAQLALADAAIGRDGKASVHVDKICRFRLDELVAALPEVVADPALDLIGYVGLLHMPVKMRFNATGRLGIRRLKIEASLRRWRLLSIRYGKERVWVERWLHMIDRCLTRQPKAAASVIDTATMIRGYGDPYRYGMANWTLIIDTLVKPALSGDLALPDLPAAIAEARAAARPDRRQAALKRAIAAIRDRSGAPAMPASAQL
jgi:hypothetical protein